ncbi:hypothetical protein H7Y40_02655 [Pedobacter sp.]|nr:hypothetical protein [Candidatus Saccharibacteria bacterium]
MSMSETCPIEFPMPKWMTELVTECRESGHASEAEMIFDLYYLMRENPIEFTADKIYEIITTTYSDSSSDTVESTEPASVIYLPLQH